MKDGKMRYPLNSTEDVQAVMMMLRAMGYACEWSGICVWIEKGARISKARERELEQMGARWAKKREQWFFRACDGLPKTIDAAA